GVPDRPDLFFDGAASPGAGSIVAHGLPTDGRELVATLYSTLGSEQIAEVVRWKAATVTPAAGVRPTITRVTLTQAMLPRPHVKIEGTGFQKDSSLEFGNAGQAFPNKNPITFVSPGILEYDPNLGDAVDWTV